MKRLVTTICFLIISAVVSLSQADEQTSVPSIKSQAEFDSLAVVYDANTSYALPHVLFVIDRQ